MSLGVAVLIGLSAQALSFDGPIGVQSFTDPRNPPPYRILDERESAQVALGAAVFNTQWTAAGSTDRAGRLGLGPLFNANSCEACHSNLAAAAQQRPTPVGLVIQLDAPSAAGREPDGDPVYGHVINTYALLGVQTEGFVSVRYTEIEGHYYPDGMRWRMRAPHYDLGLKRGPLAPTTLIKPRLAPALFGLGLLEAVPETVISEGASEAPVGAGRPGKAAWQVRQGARLLGRFGWQAESVSVRDQATKAFAREMGLTSAERASDDCTAAEADCLAQLSGGSPEVSAELVDAVVAFVRTRAVPRAPAAADADPAGARLFAATGCAACHRPRLPVVLPGAAGSQARAAIAPYTDLRLHDLGPEMADENALGIKAASKWRTAPLWGLGYRTRVQGHAAFLHDRRARSAEEAILWHFGEAGHARSKFVDLGPRARETLLHWLETL